MRGELAVTKKKDHTGGGTRAVVEFTAAETSVLECDKRVRIGIRRYGKLDILKNNYLTASFTWCKLNTNISEVP
jgi:hypothetical protein